jgi:hypothetical protein
LDVYMIDQMVILKATSLFDEYLMY